MYIGCEGGMLSLTQVDPGNPGLPKDPRGNDEPCPDRNECRDPEGMCRAEANCMNIFDPCSPMIGACSAPYKKCKA